MTKQRTRKELISWGKHWEQGRANKVDTGQMWRKSSTGTQEEKQKTKNPENIISRLKKALNASRPNANNSLCAKELR